MNEPEIDRELLDAHTAEDFARLIAAYTRAADTYEEAGELHRACFFLTHAWVFALEAGDDRAEILRERLIAHGRETNQ